MDVARFELAASSLQASDLPAIYALVQPSAGRSPLYRPMERAHETGNRLMGQRLVFRGPD